MDTACVAYHLEPERDELFRHMIHDEADKELSIGKLSPKMIGVKKTTI